MTFVDPKFVAWRRTVGPVTIEVRRCPGDMYMLVLYIAGFVQTFSTITTYFEEAAAIAYANTLCDALGADQPAADPTLLQRAQALLDQAAEQLVVYARPRTPVVKGDRLHNVGSGEVRTIDWVESRQPGEGIAHFEGGNWASFNVIGPDQTWRKVTDEPAPPPVKPGDRIKRPGSPQVLIVDDVHGSRVTLTDGSWVSANEIGPDAKYQKVDPVALKPGDRVRWVTRVKLYTVDSIGVDPNGLGDPAVYFTDGTWMPLDVIGPDKDWRVVDPVLDDEPSPKEGDRLADRVDGLMRTVTYVGLTSVYCDDVRILGADIGPGKRYHKVTD